jgi:hypothetical protein
MQREKWGLNFSSMAEPSESFLKRFYWLRLSTDWGWRRLFLKKSRSCWPRLWSSFIIA